MPDILQPAGSINNIQGIKLKNGWNKIDLSVVEMKVLEYLSNNSLGIYATAFVENPGQVKAGTVVYRVPELIKTKSYDAIDNVNEIPNVGTVKVNLDHARIAKWELETFDLTGNELSGQLEARIAEGLAISMAATLDAELFKFIETKATEIKNKDALSIDLEKLRKARIEIADINTDLTTIITKQMIGSNEEATLTIASPKFYSRLVEGLTTAGSDKGFDAKIYGNIPGAKIAGYNIVKHTYLGQNVPTNAFSDITALDLSKTQAFIINRLAVAFPVDIKEIEVTKSEKTLNPVYGVKFRFGLEELRPKLLKKYTINA